MADTKEPLMTGQQPPRIDVEKGKAKADSYIAATETPRDQPIEYKKELDDVQVVVPTQFVGLTKEELEKYRNDPFWRRLRLFLFILFWVAWIVMFAIAILLVIFSPKCPPRNIPEWWQRKVCYQAWTPSFQDSDKDGKGDLKGFTERLNNLRRIGVQTIRPTPLIAHNDEFAGFDHGYDVMLFREVQHSYVKGTEGLKTLIEETHDNDMYFVMDLPLTTMSYKSLWFEESASDKDEKTDWFIWRGDNAGKGEIFSALNNGRGNKFYRHVKNKKKLAVLNWQLKAVQQEMLNITKYWLDYGVDGFFIPHPEVFALDNNLEKPDWDQAAEYMNKIRMEMDNYTAEHDRDVPLLLFTATDEEMTEAQKLSFLEKSGVNFIVNKHLTEINKNKPECKTSRAKCIGDVLEEVMDFHERQNETWPMWEIGNPSVSRVASRLADANESQLLMMLELMLPGSLNFYYGDEIGMVDLPKDELPNSASAPDGHDPRQQRSPMQWTGEEKNAGFSKLDDLAGAKLIPVNKNYKTVNFETQYYQWLTAVKMFRRLAKLRQNDDVLMRGAFVLGNEEQLKQNVLTFARYPKPFLKKTAAYVGALNFGQEDQWIEFDQNVLPLNDGDRGAGMVITITANLGAKGEYWPRKEIKLNEKFKLGPREGIVIRVYKKSTPDGTEELED